jgi:hypothetical protein
MTPFITAGGAFLLTILYADLMFDVQVARHRDGALPESVLASIAGYYGRVVISARPLNRLVVVVMGLTLAAIVGQLVGDDAPDWVAIASLFLAGGPIALAAARTFPDAVRLGGRSDPPEVQARLARGIYRDHLLCLAGIVSLLVVQLAFAR